MKMRPLIAVLLCLSAAPAAAERCNVLGTEVICSTAAAARLAENPERDGPALWQPGYAAPEQTHRATARGIVIEPDKTPSCRRIGSAQLCS
ncbi:MAG: hypothetical protein KDK24_09840 [Pseudooceanicola sp.]|nr:hypothetical protein [Pseudooceanicola sp.]